MESGKISMPQEAIATTYQHRENHPHLIVLCGPSGSGKSSWLVTNHTGYTVISPDNLKEHFNGDRDSQDNKGQIMQYAKEQLRVALRDKQGVIWDATNLRTDFRSVVCGLGRDYYALVTLVVFILSEKKIYKNNRSRTYSVADSVLQKQLTKYQMPLLSETHQYQVVDADGKTQFHSATSKIPVTNHTPRNSHRITLLNKSTNYIDDYFSLRLSKPSKRLVDTPLRLTAFFLRQKLSTHDSPISFY